MSTGEGSDHLTLNRWELFRVIFYILNWITYGDGSNKTVALTTIIIFLITAIKIYCTLYKKTNAEFLPSVRLPSAVQV